MIDGEAHVSHRAQISGPALIEREVMIEDELKFASIACSRATCTSRRAPCSIEA